MLTDRIVGAFTFRKGVYADAARDAQFTTDAWLIVLVVNFIATLGSSAATLRGERGFLGFLITVILGTLLSIAGFALSAFLVSWVGRSMFKATASFEELARAMGLANVWRVIGFLGIFSAMTPALACLLSPVTLLAGLAGLVAYFFSIREATGMDWVGVIVSVVVALIVQLIITAVLGGILAIFGLGAAMLLR
ncbi:MAG TPA: hypothetical protein DEQ80_04345 [Anaerolinea thermolimosa]|uniref:Yip1 domain-containing protein n=1 Tax=Anaerolinea thermolimosa TaxID=229919 RepID=A0A3D1JEQ0_9CHLR|nr:hypothetical protein [Anaerolinea thermolimosa]GAP08102.1 hypothetical protein ATHL_03003 [Anaerolinea thermolimosa]HCE17070.1 hypothetical protein [Anaerolinea thermolimosa]